MAKSTLIFDFFGVISTEVSPRWFAKRFSDDEARQLKEKYMSMADVGKVCEDELFSFLGSLSGEPKEDVYREFMSYVNINSELVDLIVRLKEKYKIVLLSNALASWLHKILANNDLYRCFDHIVISGEERIGKPSPEIYRTALSRAGIEASDAVFIDDNEKNTRAAEALGIRGIVYENNEGLISALKGLGIEI